MVVDLEQVDFPDRLHPWERMINSDGPMSISKIYSIRNVNRLLYEYGGLPGDFEINLGFLLARSPGHQLLVITGKDLLVITSRF
ncbi:hypothetical protein VN97_g10713 [Penicillium thymicola]|uniref:Uncharacterized protein n=1 Tax=Penicillium thymicola TaxID=293382 RepID=A0AAI9X425_PENTH|nr:hypothetical protein VN97_g10713 [Penicillium thymicola]